MCFCTELTAVPSRTRVLILRHAAEVNKTSNSGRLAALALANSRLVDHGLPDASGRGHPLDVTQELGDAPWVLAPGGASGRPTAITTLVVIDSTWVNAKSMRWRIAPLSRVPTLTLPAPAIAPLRMRRGTTDDQMATIEAIAAALELLDEPEPAAHLRRMFALMAERVQALRGFAMPPR